MAGNGAGGDACPSVPDDGLGRLQALSFSVWSIEPGPVLTVLRPPACRAEACVWGRLDVEACRGERCRRDRRI